MNAALDLRFARTPWSRTLGLLGRRNFMPGRALVFEDCVAIHTWFMAMRIDVVFVDAAWRVLDVHAAVPPWRVLRQPGAAAVLELACGEAARLGLVPGMPVAP